MIETESERRARAVRMATSTITDYGFDGALQYAEDMISVAEPYENKRFWMWVREDIITRKNPQSAPVPKYGMAAGQTSLDGVL